MGEKIYIANQSFVTVVDGAHVVVNAGRTTVREGHPLMKNREHLFEEVRVHFEHSQEPKAKPPVEQATARPGEKRQTTQRKRSTK